jgi:hypothetical protein
MLITNRHDHWHNIQNYSQRPFSKFITQIILSCPAPACQIAKEKSSLQRKPLSQRENHTRRMDQNKSLARGGGLPVAMTPTVVAAPTDVSDPELVLILCSSKQSPITITIITIRQLKQRAALHYGWPGGHPSIHHGAEVVQVGAETQRGRRAGPQGTSTVVQRGCTGAEQVVQRWCRGVGRWCRDDSAEMVQRWWCREVVVQHVQVQVHRWWRCGAAEVQVQR